MSPQDLKSVLQAGLLSFPLTDFDSELRFAPKPYADRLEWLQPYGASALFAAGGTGEFFSLEPGEYSEVIKVALATCKNRTPIIAGAGGGTTPNFTLLHTACTWAIRPSWLASVR